MQVLKHRNDAEMDIDDTYEFLSEIHDNLQFDIPYYSSQEDIGEMKEFIDLTAKRLRIEPSEIHKLGFKCFYDLGKWVYENHYSDASNIYQDKCDVFFAILEKNIIKDYEERGLTKADARISLNMCLDDAFNVGFIWVGLSAEILDAETAEEINDIFI